LLSTKPLLTLPLLIALAACGGGGSGGTGTMKLSLTDAPACQELEEVNVTVQRVLVHKSSTAGDSDAGWVTVADLGAGRRINLRTLTNGVLDELGQANLDAGRYTQLRLVLAENDGTAPLENSIERVGGGGEIALDTPSAQQSGLKLNNLNLTVAADQVADVVLDFDACKSVVKRGNSGQYNLKPVITVIPVLSSTNQRVVGWVDPVLALDSTSISVQSTGSVARATPPITADGLDKGKFVLFPVPVGSYDLVITANGRATAVMTGVPVTETAITYANAASAPISMPASAMRAAAGAVSRNGSFEDSDAEVAVTQQLDGTLTVEVAAQPVDALDGTFAFSLPASAPLRAAYASGATPTFTAVDAAAGLYRLIASVFGEAPQTEDLDVGAADAPPTTFMFP
jgi:hypothetical protein